MNDLLLKDYPFKAEEVVLRRHWFIATMISLVLFPLLVFISLSFFEGDLILENWTQNLLKEILTGIFQCWLIWYCAYRKPGTALLTWWLVLGVLQPLVSLYVISETPFYALHVGIQLMDLALFAWWWFLSLKLRRLNKKIQLDTFVSSEVYRDSINSIRSAINLDDLNFKYHDAIRERPAHFSIALLPHFEEMKKQLSKTSL